MKAVSVLILLLLELTFWATEFGEAEGLPQVLILLLLELTFWEGDRPNFRQVSGRLNPSFTGTYLLRYCYEHKGI